MKTCITCRHAEWDGYSLFGKRWGGVWRCSRTAYLSELRTNPVTGFTWRDDIGPAMCEWERRSTGECGPDGKHWEAK